MKLRIIFHKDHRDPSSQVLDGFPLCSTEFLLSKEFLSLVLGLGASEHIDREGVAENSSHLGRPEGEKNNAYTSVSFIFYCILAQAYGMASHTFEFSHAQVFFTNLLSRPHSNKYISK